MKWIWIGVLMCVVLECEIFLLVRLDSLNLQTWEQQVKLNQNLIDAYDQSNS